MSERFFRIILGASLLFILLFRQNTLMYVYIGVLLFEGLTNWRIPILISRLRYNKNFKPEVPNECTCKINFDAERALRLVITVVLIISFVLFKDLLWFIPWFIGFALTMAGVTGVCPMALSFKKLGFR